MTSTSTDGNAGGLIGSATGTTVDSCYSTCSVKGNTAGGFIGSGSNTVTNCYATGFVTGTNKGAFAGSFKGTLTGNRYYEIINEQVNKDGSGNVSSISYLQPVGGTNPAATAISALDATASAYNSFSGDAEEWNVAEPEDTALKIWYKGKYNLQTISQLLGPKAESAEYAFFNTHYGDWPAPEIFVINEETGSGSGEAGG